MKTIVIGIASLLLGLGAIIAADQAGLIRGDATERGEVDAPSTPASETLARESAASGRIGAPNSPVPEGQAAGDDAPAGSAQRLLREPSPTCSKADTPIVLGHPGVVDMAGIKLARARATESGASFQVTGRIAFPADRHARLSSRAAGVVTELHVDLGQKVTAGDELLTVDSAELGNAKAALRQASALVSLWERNVSREQHLVDKGVGREADLIVAETRLAEAQAKQDAARQKLRNLGLPPEAIAAARRGEDQDSSLALHAPFDGVVIDLAAAPGQAAETGSVLVTVADPRHVWALLDVPEQKLSILREGVRVVVRPQGHRGQAAEGAVTWIAPQVDERTRTVTARVELANPDGRLRAGQFITGTVPIGGDEDLVLVPRAAVQWDGCCNVVFVPGASGNQFLTRKVQVAHAVGDQVAIRSGIDDGSEVVTTGSWMLKTEILKGSIGAGCCEVK